MSAERAALIRPRILQLVPGPGRTFAGFVVSQPLAGRSCAQGDLMREPGEVRW
jgi:hypothetical protein